MIYDSGTVADKLKLIRLGKENRVPFKCNDEEFVGRQLDWVEQMQIDAEVKTALHAEKIDFSDPDHLMYRMMATLNKGVFVEPGENGIPEWIEKAQRSGGYEYLRSLYTSYMDTVYPKIEESSQENGETKPDGKKE